MDWDRWFEFGLLVGLAILLVLDQHRRHRWLVMRGYGPVTAELIRVLHELRRAFAERGEAEWSEWMAKTVQRFEVTDYDGVDHWLCVRGKADELGAWLAEQQDPGVEPIRALVGRADELVARIRDDGLV